MGAVVDSAVTSQTHSGSNGFGHQLGTVIVWFRRDLRVADNPALCAAVQAAKEVVRACASLLDVSMLMPTRALLNELLAMYCAVPQPHICKASPLPFANACP